MRRFFLAVVIIFFSIGYGFCQTGSYKTEYPRNSTSKPISHAQFNQVLQKYVDNDGYVNYTKLKAEPELLNAYTRLVSRTEVNPNWSKEEKLAFWINAYNAFTLKLIIDNYPIKNIMAIHPGIPNFNSVWEKKFINMGGVKLSLGQIEHDIIREEYGEPLIHFVISCASISCPALHNQAFTPSNINRLLKDRAKVFFYDATKNKIDGNILYLSKIFQWYNKDFGGSKENIIKYIDHYLEKKIPEGIEVKTMPYNWKLNDILNK